ncbi:hypothetical protein [Hymenobacter nivis]|uniref:hypothetical protein n=1 Tax=Hymenobacter nivis TaxID=1850093 RepID=UPI0013A52B87|nr:hypothetical protein [Hymenobacter nivis]
MGPGTNRLCWPSWPSCWTPPTHPHDQFDGLALMVDFAGLGPRRVVLYGRRLLRQGRSTGQVLLGVEVVAPPA